MDIKKKIKHLIKHSSDEHGINDDIFLSQGIFRKIIDREKDRANRTGEIFSLVVFILPDSHEKAEAAILLCETLSPQVRSIDTIGWLDSHRVGALLPETDYNGARKFLKKLHLEALPNHLEQNNEIFTYPSETLTHPDKASLNSVTQRPKKQEYRQSAHGGWHFAQTMQNHDYMFCLPKRVLKRCFDIMVASICLIIFSPVFLLAAILIKAASSGPVFFKQQRIGYGGHPFTFYKFRTMRQGSDTQEHRAHLAQLIRGNGNEGGADSPMVKLDHDPQIIPFGNILRKSCLDELPQLINVLRGDMSLVGPRPPIPYEVKEYNSWHWGRFNAMPGMTGLWQVSGKNKLSFREMVRLDICYARERSLWMDIKILFRTPLAILEQLWGSMACKNSTLNEGV